MANMPAKRGEIEVEWAVKEGASMGGLDKKTQKDKPKDGSKKSPPQNVEDDDIEDGDFATPKRDRTGNDDEPLS